VLFSGFAWLVVGLVLLALGSLDLLPLAPARHALTVGGIGVVTLGMMARVALGHTGRPMQPPRLVEWAFVAVNLAAALRVFGPMVDPARLPVWLDASGGLWLASFLAFLYYYAPILLSPRADGQPG
jgi:uncharacterized protein involved in response to NO